MCGEGFYHRSAGACSVCAPHIAELPLRIRTGRAVANDARKDKSCFRRNRNAALRTDRRPGENAFPDLTLAAVPGAIPAGICRRREDAVTEDRQK